MARLDLQTRASRIAPILKRTDIQELPNSVRVQLERFTKAIGIPFERFVNYSPATRAKYLRAARKGRTATQERQRVREQRAARGRVSVPYGVQRDPRIVEINRISSELRPYLNTHRSPMTQVDGIAAEELLSPESITEHIKVYGIQYVYDHLKEMEDSFNAGQPIGQGKWRAFKASAAYPETDERWFWYHKSTLYYGIGG